QQKDLFRTWSFEKTIRNRANKNLSYRADKYNFSDEEVLQPLKYDIEPFNFLRIEGHLGKPYKEAVTEILKNRNQFNLPFDVVALNVRKLRAGRSTLKAKCYFQDLESLYNVLLGELLCKIHHPVCFIARLPFLDLTKLRDE